jgi:hypothetical protein
VVEISSRVSAGDEDVVVHRAATLANDTNQGSVLNTVPMYASDAAVLSELPAMVAAINVHNTSATRPCVTMLVVRMESVWPGFD